MLNRFTKRAEAVLQSAKRNAEVGKLLDYGFANYETYVSSVVVYFTTDETTEEQAREQAVAYLDSIGNTKEAMLESMIASYMDEQLYNYIVEGVTVTEEDVKTAYDALVAETFGKWYAFENIPWYIMGATAAALMVVAIVQFNGKIKK